MEPEKWFAQYDAKLRRAGENAKEAESQLREVGGSATSPDGLITVRVNASGAPVDLVLRPQLRGADPAYLAGLIMDTTRAAQRDVGRQVVNVMYELLGASPALDAVKEGLPEGYAGDGAERPDLRPDTRADDDYFASPPGLIQ